MNRRAFLGTMIGGVSAAAAVRTWPFRVFSFPTEVVTTPRTIRFVRAYDIASDRFINRFDVLYGWMQLDNPPSLKLELPQAVEQAEMISANPNFSLSKKDLKRVAEKCVNRYGLAVPAEHVVNILEDRGKLNEVMIRGCDVASYPRCELDKQQILA